MTTPSDGARSKRVGVAYEALAVALSTLCLVSGMWGFLSRADTTFTHDNLYWAYANFTFVAESLLGGTIPLWDPYSHGGEAFFPTLCHGRYLDPTVPLVVFVGRLFTRDSLMLFHWLRFVQVWVMLFGVYLALRRYATRPLTRATLAGAVFLSSLAYAPFRQDALLLQFQWIPYVAHLLLGIVFEGRRSWSRWLLLSAAVGLSSQSYWFSSTWVFLALFAFALAAFYRDHLRAMLRDRSLLAPVAVFVLVNAAMAVPNAALVREGREMVFSTRSLPAGYERRASIGAPIQYEGRRGGPSVQATRMPYSAIEYSGTPLTYWNLFQTLGPSGNAHVHASGFWGEPSEAVIYLGAFGWALALFGMLSARHASKPLWLTITVGAGLLSLGPGGALHRLLYPVFPMLWPVRHPVLYALTLVMGILYFALLGLEAALSPRDAQHEAPPSPRRAVWALALFVSLAALTVAMVVFEARPLVTSLLLLAIGAVVALSRRVLAAWVVTAAVIAVQGAVAVALSPSPVAVGARLVVALGLPLAFVVASRAAVDQPRRAELFATLACAALLLDLRDGLAQVRRLFSTQPRPPLELGFDPNLAPVTAPGPRRVHPPYRPDAYPRQVIRYMAQLYRTPFALSPPVALARVPGVLDLDFAAALRSTRWNSHFLSRTYFELVTSEVAPEVLERLFAIGRAPLQFRPRARVVAPEQWLRELAQRPVADALAEVDEVVALHPADGAAPPLASASGPTDFEARVVAYTHNDVALDVRSTQPGYLLDVDGYAPSWHATVDGREVALWRADYGFKALALPAGRHRVHLRYRPTLFIAGLCAFEGALALSVAGALAAALAARRRAVRRSLHSRSKG